MHKKLISALLVFVMTLTCAGCNATDFKKGAPEENTNSNVEAETTSPAPAESNSKRLKILSTDYQVTPEEKLSQIKAEYLIKNNGYSDNDEIVAILSLPGDSVIDAYNKSGFAGTVSEYAETADGVFRINDLNKRQAALINNLYGMGLIKSVGYTYTTVANAISVTTTYGDFNKIEQLSGGLIDRAVISETYSHPKAVSEDSGLVENVVDVYATGIYNSKSVNDLGYSGEGTSVAVLDSGFDISHSVFLIPDSEMETALEKREASAGHEIGFSVTKEKVESLISTAKDKLNSPNYQEGGTTEEDEWDAKLPKLLGNGVMNSVEATPSLIADNVYHSYKVPYAYDYADRDYDVFPYDSEHGTHVAGIIGGYSADGYLDADGNRVMENGQVVEFRGVAKYTQLVLMKVFQDLQAGAEEDDILAALEDAVLLGVDAINMSLGTSCGFSREVDESYTNKVYDSVYAAGINLVTAASNDYSSGYGGEQGNTSFVTNPDSGTVGSPSTYKAAISVASVSGQKSKYLYANDQDIIYFNESSATSGKSNDFFKELYGVLNTPTTKDLELEYVTVPGIGDRNSYSGIADLIQGKIALVRRGENSFEDKALQAKNAGAIACIIYNNVEGDILMSMGKTDHIPTISISKEDGAKLAARLTGKIRISYDNAAGPFMSDFSSWGPMPDLELRPEITAHGGNIRSSMPGGGFEELSGTSMACPNLCGVSVLIRQYLREKYPEKSVNEIAALTNQIMMSTATTVLNEQGNPYSPRKQGAGLASLEKVVTTNGYITVPDGNGGVKDKTKIELHDDPTKTGKYTMTFNVVNMGDKPLTYDVGLIGMTESVSSSDVTHVSEKSYLLSDNISVRLVSGDGSVTGKSLTVNAGKTATVELVYTLTQEDKDYLDSLFPYGMYVEGFVKLTSTSKDVDLSVPFLAFYGDWSKPPIFDKTYYEVESEAHNLGIDEEDKLKAEYYATTPYGTYYYNYMIPLGTYLYSVDTSIYDEIPASLDHIAISKEIGTIDGIRAVLAGLLRGVKHMTYTITDKVTGEVVYSHDEYNVMKSFSQGGGPIPSYSVLDISSAEEQFVNNRVYEFKMVGELDYENTGAENNVRNSFSFDFVMDEELPTITDALFEKEYDRTTRKDKYYLTLTVHDNHYVANVWPCAFTEQDRAVGLSYFTEYPIPVYGESVGEETKVRFEITDIVKNAQYDKYFTGKMAIRIEDYAMNVQVYTISLPGLDGEMMFTKDGKPDSDRITSLTMKPGEVVDLSEYIVAFDENGNPIEDVKDYFKYLNWTTSNPTMATVDDGLVVALKAGRQPVTITAEAYNGYTTPERTVSISITITDDASATAATSKVSLASAPMTVATQMNDARPESIRFAYFDTVFAYPAGDDISSIGENKDRTYITGAGGTIEMYPGERIRLAYEVTPWYIPQVTDDSGNPKFTLSYSSTNKSVASVDGTGGVQALKEGSARIVLSISGSNLQARVNIVVKSPFVIDEARTLVAYKGMGGRVVIPDDEGLMYIGPFAFSSYDIDLDYGELPDDDQYANRTARVNETVTSVVIPEGVEDIQAFAFANCINLTEVRLPESCKFIREYAFYNCPKLKTINFGGTKVQTIGARAFENCTSLEDVDLSHVLAVGANAFRNSGIKKADLSALRNAWAGVFSGCKSLEEVVLDATNSNGFSFTKLSEGMFSGCTSLKKVYPAGSAAENGKFEINVNAGVPANCFNGCTSLENLILNTPVLASQLGDGAFKGCTKLASVTLPDNAVTYGDSVFGGCTHLTTLVFRDNTRINGDIRAFAGANITAFAAGSTGHYTTGMNGALLLDGTTVILAAPAYDFSESPLVLGTGYSEIAEGAFAGTNVKEIEITNPNLKIGAYAFADCAGLTKVTFPSAADILEIGAYAFVQFTSNGNLTTSAIKEAVNLGKVKTIGERAFAYSSLSMVDIAENATVGAGAFMGTSATSANIGNGATLGDGAFASSGITNATFGTKVTLGESCFENSSLESANLSAFQNIPAYAFAYTKLKEIDLTAAEIIGEGAFIGCEDLAGINNLKAVKEIGAFAFSADITIRMGRLVISKNPAYTSISLPATLTAIGEYAFLGSKLTAVTIPQTVETLSAYAFAYSTALATVEMNGVNTVGEGAFEGCTALTTVTGSAVTTVEAYAFNGDSMLSAFDFGRTTKIGAMAFGGTTALTEVNAAKLTEVGEGAFMESGVATFTAANLRIIGSSAFAYTAISEFTFSSHLESVGSSAFAYCENLTTFKTSGGKTDGDISAYAHLTDGVLYTHTTAGKYVLSAVPTAKTFENGKFEVEEGTVRVAEFAAAGNTNIKDLALPDSLGAIENFAFYGCTALESVEFRSSVAPTLENYMDSAITAGYETTLSPEDPGYKVLFGNSGTIWESDYGYFQFVGLVGKREGLKIILPKNADLEGYDSVIYKAYFNTAEAERSNYTAMEKNMRLFLEYAAKVEALGENVTLGDEDLVTKAQTAMNAIKQDPTAYGISADEWDTLKDCVNRAVAKIKATKTANMSKTARDIQARIDALPDKYDESETQKQMYLDLTLAINSLRVKSDIEALDLTKYNIFRASYESAAGRNPGGTVDPSGPDTPGPDNPSGGTANGTDLTWLWILLGVVGGLIVLGGAAVLVIVILKKRGVIENKAQDETAEPDTDKWSNWAEGKGTPVAAVVFKKNSKQVYTYDSAEGKWNKAGTEKSDEPATAETETAAEETVKEEEAVSAETEGMEEDSLNNASEEPVKEDGSNETSEESPAETPKDEN